MPTAHRTVVACLIGISLSLLVVGVVSDTLIRHVIQITPLVLAAALLARGQAWAAYGAMPLFVLWLAIPVLIWLFLLGLSRIASGRFTPIEVVMTFVMAGLSVFGLVVAPRAGRNAGVLARVAAFAAFALLQVVAMMVSFTDAVKNR
jgi:hypothetical protein